MAHVEKRGPRRYRARYRGPDGREHSRTFGRRVDAERFIASVEADKLRGTWRDPAAGRITYGEWSDRYFAGAVHKRPTTMARDRRVNNKHFVPAFGHRALASITPGDVQELIRQMAITLAPATVRTDYSVLRAILSAAVASDIIAVSPCRGVKLPAADAPGPRFLTPEELMALSEAMPPEYSAMVLLAGVGGLRWSEVAGLRVGRIDFLRRTVEVVETVKEVEGELIFDKPKTRASHRTIAIPRFLADVLASHLASAGRSSSDDLVFTAPEGGPLRGSSFRSRVWRPATSAAGFAGLKFHELRHTAVALMVEADAHPRAIQERLGHGSVRTTMDVYGHVLPATDKAITSRLEQRFETVRGLDAASGE